MAQAQGRKAGGEVTQKAQILAYLKSGRSITVLDALQRFGCYALSQRIGELRRAGHPISSRMIRTTTGKDIAQYAYTPQIEILQCADQRLRQQEGACPLPGTAHA